MDKIPSTFSMNEIQSLAKLFDTWYDEKKSRDKKLRKQKAKKFVQKYLGWISLVASQLKPVYELIKSMFA